MLLHSLPPPSPTIPACQWCGPLIGGPGLSRHGNCTKANKGVEQSRGNTVTQRGYLAQWKISGETHTKAKPLLNTREHGALFCLSLRTARLNAQMAKCCSLLVCNNNISHQFPVCRLPAWNYINICKYQYWRCD